MSLNIALPELKHKWIKIYDSEEQRLNEEENWQDNYEECCVSIDKNSLAGDNNKEEYQYSVRTTNNDNEKKGIYYNVEISHYWAGLEIIWGYFGWEYVDYEYNSQKLKGGNLFKKIECTIVKTIPDGLKLQHINNFLGSQNKVKEIDYFDNTNIISAENLIGYESEDYDRLIKVHNTIWPNVINAKRMFQNARFITVDDNLFELPNAEDCSYLMYNKVSAGSDNRYPIKAPNAKILDYAYYNYNIDYGLDSYELIDYNKAISAKYIFAADDNGYVNITRISLQNVIDATGFIKGVYNCSDINLPNVEIVDYFNSDCSNGISYVQINSNKIKSAKGFSKNNIFSVISVFMHINNMLNLNSNIKVLDEFYYNTTFNDDGTIYLDLSSFDTNNPTIKNFISNVKSDNNNLIRCYIQGNINTDYTDFMCNSKNIEFVEDTLYRYHTNINEGSCYIRAFKGSYLSKHIYQGQFPDLQYSVFPITSFNNNINYFECFAEGKILDNMIIITNGFPKVTFNVFKNTKFVEFNTDANMFINLPHVNLNFNVGNIDNNGNDIGNNVINDLFDYQISDNVADFGFGEDYIGYKDFTIEEQFNYKEIKAQTINVCLFRKIIEYGISAKNHDNYIINNNTFVNENNIVLNLKSCPPNNVEDWQIPEDKKDEDNPHYNYEHFYIQSTSMKNLTLRGDINLYREQTIYNFFAVCPALINLDLQWDVNGSWRDTITIDNDILEGFLLRHYNGTVYITSTKINIDNLKQSIDWWVEDNVYIQNFSIKQSVYNQLDEEYKSKFIAKCGTLNIIQ